MATDVTALAAFVESRRPSGGRDAPGAAVAVRTADGWTSVCAGAADLSTGRAIDEHTGFRIASLSKPLLGLALLRLEAENRLSFDDPLARHLPWMREAAGDTTIRDFASHRSGFHEKLELLTLAGADHTQKIPLRTVRSLLARQRDCNFEPGSGYLYCNTGFTLLSDVLEAVTGRSFADALHQLVVGPLGMDRTTVLEHDDGIVPGMARGHVGPAGERRHGFYGFPVRGEGGVISCLADLKRFADAVIADDLPGVPRSRIAGADHPMFGYAAGFVLRRIGTTAVVGHAGHLPGFKSEIAIAADARAAVVWLANDDTADAYAATSALLRAALGRPKPSPERLPDELAGRWVDTTEGAILDIVPTTGSAALFGDPFPLVADGDGWRADADVIDLLVRPSARGLALTQGGRDLGPLLHDDRSGWTTAHDMLRGRWICAQANTELEIRREAGGFAVSTRGPFGHRGPEPLDPLPGGRMLWRAWRDPWTVWYVLAPGTSGSDIAISSARMRNLRAVRQTGVKTGC